jgi:prolipoprotein diacylglyceryltransferase
VQLDESAAMAAFLCFTVVQLARRDAFFLRNGFYLLVLWYAGQRFAWEFLKPYAHVVGPLNLFHCICLGLVCYAAWMMRSHPALPE